MDNRDYRWTAGILLLAVFGVLAYGGGAAPKAQGTQNVLVTNTSSQPVPVAVPARPTVSGAYIVSVANAPSVKVVSSPASPVFTKDSNNPDTNGAINIGSFAMISSVSGFGPTMFALSSQPVVIDEISIHGESAVAGECIDDGAFEVFTSGAVLDGTFYFAIPAVQNSAFAASYMGSVHIPVPANGYVQPRVYRHGGVTNNCTVNFTLSYHTVPNP